MQTMSNAPQLSAQERLARSREAIVKHMNRNHPDHDGDRMAYAAGEADDARSSRRRPFGIVMQAIRIWWHRHPASTAVELARPLLDDYAAAHPYKLLGAAAGVGAMAVLIRPWRMVSVGSLLLAAARSSGASGILLSLLTNRSEFSQNNQEAP